MTEAEWQACTDPVRMLEFLDAIGPTRHRKQRLFAVACCRRVAHLITDSRALAALDLTERHADGTASSEEFWAGALAARRAYTADESPDAHTAVHLAVAYAVSHCIDWKACRAIADLIGSAAFEAAPSLPQSAARDVMEAEKLAHCALLRDILGNSCRGMIADWAWLIWKDSTISKIAQAVYTRGRFEDLPILADALEEAGCTDAAILDHCRGPGPHVRGCWVVDLILGKA
jgi:hypothetical protein